MYLLSKHASDSHRARPRATFALRLAAASLAVLASGPLGLACNSSDVDAPSSESEIAEPWAAELEPWFGAQASVVHGAPPHAEFAVSIDARLSAEGGSVEASSLELRGTWRLVAVESQDTNSWVLAQLRVDHLALPADHAVAVGPEEYTRRIRSELERPVLLELGQNAAVVGLKAPADLVSTALGAIKMLAASLQFSRPISDQASWSGVEGDATGLYQAKYERLDATVVERTKLEYVKLPPAPTTLAQQGSSAQHSTSRFEIKEARNTYTLAADGWLQRIEGKESVVSRADETLPELHSECSWRLTRRADATPLELAHELVTSLQQETKATLHAPTPPAGYAYELDLAKVGPEAKLAPLLAELATLEPSRDPDQGTRARRLQLALRALLRLSSAAERDAWAHVEASGNSTDAVLGALAHSGSAESQARVMQLLVKAERLRPAMRNDLLISLSTHATASTPLLDGAIQMTKDPVLGNQALLALGSMAFRLRESAPALATRALSELTSRLAKTSDRQDFEQLDLLLRALGNAGHPDSLSHLEAFLGASRADVRASAVGALRRIPGAHIDDRLKRIKATDGEPEVQQSVLTVALERAGEGS
jgi:hypothetical protein